MIILITFASYDCDIDYYNELLVIRKLLFIVIFILKVEMYYHVVIIITMIHFYRKRKTRGKKKKPDVKQWRGKNWKINENKERYEGSRKSYIFHIHCHCFWL